MQASQAAIQVIACAIEGHVPLIVDLEQQARALRVALHSYAGTWFQNAGSGPEASPVAPHIALLLREPVLNADTRADPQMVEEFQSLHARLLENPEAEIG